ncbi:MAG: DUF4249 domain-containing protein [Cyclobacteriaceae bacterium]|jgi:hypothetical protein
MRAIVFLVLWVFIDACIDRIDLVIPPSTLGDIVVDGLITSDPGPYTVRLNSVIRSDDSRPLGIPLTAVKVVMYDDQGNSEEMEQVIDGEYQTSPAGMRGVVGRSYHIRIEMGDGSVFESIPDKLGPVGTVDSVFWEFETALKTDGPPEYRYRIFMNASAATGEDKYYRWKLNGTYVVKTEPKYTHCPFAPCRWCPDPCSGAAIIAGVSEPQEGYAYNPATKEIEYVIGLSCTCCRCWVTAAELKPRVTDTKLSSNGKFLNVEVGTIPVNYYTFWEKYRAEVQQMSLSRQAFDYWYAVQAQKEGIGSLFQPIGGKIPTNLFEINGKKRVYGIFYAASISRKQIYLDKNTRRIPEIRVPEDDCNGILRAGPIGKDCRIAFPGQRSTTTRPADWVD